MAVSKESSCAFYVSDYHLEMIMLPYINNFLNNKEKVYVFTQNNLEESISHLLKNVNMDETRKKQILEINWKNEDENKYKNIIDENEKSIIFIKGNEKYIEKTNQNLNQIKEHKNVEIIDCYSIEEIGNNTGNIRKKYDKVLTTNGLKNET